jgi:hypothetical protein
MSAYSKILIIIIKRPTDFPINDNYKNPAFIIIIFIIACQPGTYKRSAGNDNRCLNCPLNSWSYNQAAEKCDCLRNYFRDDDFNASSDCRGLYRK